MFREALILDLEIKWQQRKKHAITGMKEIEHRVGSFDEGPSFGFSYGYMQCPAPYFAVALWNNERCEGRAFEQDVFVLPLPTVYFLARTIHDCFADDTDHYKNMLLQSLTDHLYEEIFSRYATRTAFAVLQDEQWLKRVLEEASRQ